MARPPRHAAGVAVSRDEACLAVRLYNDSAETRSFEAFVVHMHLAWLYLLQAELVRDRVDHRHRDPQNPRRLLRVEGEPKLWSLAHTARHRWPDPANPVRKNLEFSIALRNKIEHRFVRQQNAMCLAFGGHAQALLLNYETELSGQFGVDQSLATRLRFPVFVGTFTPGGETALRRLRDTLPAPLRAFAAEHASALDPAVAGDDRYEFRLRLVPELAPRDPDALPLRFTRLDDMTDEQRTAVEALGRTGSVIVREQTRAVANAGRLKPREATKAVEEAIPFVFTVNSFTAAWRTLGVRPPTGDQNPERTDEKYCVYDELHRDYGYTPAFVKKVIKAASTEKGFRDLVGRAPKAKPPGPHAAPRMDG